MRKSPFSSCGLVLGAWHGSMSCVGLILWFFISLDSLFVKRLKINCHRRFTLSLRYYLSKGARLLFKKSVKSLRSSQLSLLVWYVVRVVLWASCTPKLQRRPNHHAPCSQFPAFYRRNAKAPENEAADTDRMSMAKLLAILRADKIQLIGILN